MIAWCCRKDCKNEAELLPVVKLWASRAVHGPHEPALMHMGLPVCRRCSRDLKVTDLIGPGGWQPIVAAFMRGGKARPDLSSAQLEWIPLNSAEALEFIATIPAPNKDLIH